MLILDIGLETYMVWKTAPENGVDLWHQFLERLSRVLGTDVWVKGAGVESMRGGTLDPVTWENISASAITNNNVHDRQTQNYIETRRREWKDVTHRPGLDGKNNSTNNAQNPLHTFPRNFPVDGEVAKLLATSRCNGIWETTRHNRHNGLLPATTCCGLATGKLV